MLQLDEIQVWLNFISARLNGKKMAIKIENISKKIFQIMVFDKNLYIA
jgi:hypothetical protein